MDFHEQDTPKPKVCIIEAGPSGILAARHLKEVSHVQVFEAKNDIGGVWLYTDTTEFNDTDISNNWYYNLYGWLHPSMYKDLLTNIPKYMMTFKDFYMHSSTPHIMTHWEFSKYLNSYADKFELRDYIKLNTIVKSVVVDETSPHRYWVKYGSVNMKEPIDDTTDLFDFVLVWSGRFYLPNIPDFEGKDKFKGTQLHIHNFRTLDPELFDDK